MLSLEPNPLYIYLYKGLGTFGPRIEDIFLSSRDPSIGKPIEIVSVHRNRFRDLRFMEKAGKDVCNIVIVAHN